MATVRVSSRRSGTDVAESLATVTESLKSAPADVVSAGVPVARAAILDTYRNTRGTLSVSGLGATLDVSTTESTAESTADAELVPTPPGPFALVEFGARDHEITPSRRYRGMPTPYGVFRRVHHNGTTGLHLWETACASADEAVSEAAKSVTDAVTDNA